MSKSKLPTCSWRSFLRLGVGLAAGYCREAIRLLEEIRKEPRAEKVLERSDPRVQELLRRMNFPP